MTLKIRTIKKTLKIIWLTFVAVTAAFLAAILAIQLPQVQTFLTGKVLEAVEGRLDGEIVLEKIHVKPFNALVIKNVAVIDRHPAAENADTLFKAGYVIARFSVNGLFRKEGLYIGRAYVSDAEMTLVIEGERLNNLTRIFRISPPDRNRPKNENPVFRIRRATVSDMTFRLKNTVGKHNYNGYGIDWDNIEVNDINIEARRIDLTGNVMSGSVDFMTFTEKSGYVCNSLSGRARVGNGQSIIEEIRISDPWSELYVPLYSMSYNAPTDFADYIARIRMESIVENSSLDMKTLSFFAPGLENVQMKTTLSGKVSGTVDNLELKDMSIATADGVRLSFDGSMHGLPDIGRTFFSLSLHEMNTTTAGLEATVKSFSRDSDIGIGKVAENVSFRLTGEASGTLDNLNAGLTASVDSGYVRSDLNIRHLLSKNSPMKISGRIASENFDIGRITGSRLVRQCSMKAGLSAEFMKDGSTPELTIDTLAVTRLRMNDYDYGNIAAAGVMKSHAFDGRIICNDPNLSFMFQGVFSLSAKTMNSIYKFYANIGYADLNALNIDKRGKSRISLQALANFNRRQAGDILGKMDIENITLENGTGRYDIGNINILSYFGDELYRMRMNSSFADASYAGSERITRFFSDLRDITLRRELPDLFRDTVSFRENDRYRLSFRCKDSMDLLAFLAPGMYISDSTSLDIRIDSSGVFRADMESPRIAFNENYIKDMTLKSDNINGSLTGILSGRTMNIAGITLENNSFRIYAKDNFIGFGYAYENPGELVNRGEVYITGDIRRNESGKMNYSIMMHPSRLLLNSREWNINRSSIGIDGKEINIGLVEFTSGDQSVKISGGYSGERKDTLTMRLERFDISVINPLLKNRFGIEGALTGEASISSESEGLGLKLEFLGDSTRIAGADVGTLRIDSSWESGTDRYSLQASNELDGRRTFSIDGSYFPDKRRILAEANLHGLDISYAQPFLESVFSDMSGYISGRIIAEGPLDDLSIKSENARIDNSALRIAFTNVPYNLSGDFHIDDTGVHFDDISLHDRYGNSGRITGGIIYDKMKDIRLDAMINISGMECLNTDEDDNSSFYGNLSASGSLAVTGPLNALMLEAEASTSGSGQIHIPIPSSATASAGELLTFRQIEKEEYIDPYELMIKKIKTEKKSGGTFGIRLNVAADPDVEAFVEIDKATGNVLRGRGAGNIELEIRDNDFSILGDYTLTSGNYRFVAQELAFRDFTISDGSSIKFNGDIMESDLDINATYRTKASLATLIADTSSVATRRTVDCGINITDKLKNPRLAFSIDIPDIDPTIKSRVESALSTEDKIQKQFLSLIVFNSFLPDDQSGVVNNSSFLYSTVTELMYNQLNNIFQKLDIPLDLGLSYQPNERGEDIFDVAVSTQLFNNRVTVNGNLGNRQYSSGSSSDVVGDLDIEIKLDRPGLFRLNIFSHSADQYTNYLDDSQRNGIGIAYQQEFNTFREFFRNLFTGMKKKQAREQEASAAETTQKRKTIIIGPENE